MYSKYSHHDDYSLSRSEYYEHRLFPKNMNLFHRVWQGHDATLAVGLPTVFRGLPFGGHPKAVSRNIGEPRFVSEKQGLSSLVFFYKEKIYNYAVMTQLHFLDNEFYYACYTFRNENEAQRKLIRRVLFEKYANGQENLSERYSRILDPEGNTISIFDDVHFNILYLWGDEKIKSALNYHFRKEYSHKEALKRKGELDLRNKL